MDRYSEDDTFDTSKAGYFNSLRVWNWRGDSVQK